MKSEPRPLGWTALIVIVLVIAAIGFGLFMLVTRLTFEHVFGG